MTGVETIATVEITGVLAKETVIYALYERTKSAHATFTLNFKSGYAISPDTTIEICYDSDDVGELGVLVRAISLAGGIKAQGVLDDSIHCDHRVEATHIEPWAPEPPRE